MTLKVPPSMYSTVLALPLWPPIKEVFSKELVQNGSVRDQVVVGTMGNLSIIKHINTFHYEAHMNVCT